MTGYANEGFGRIRGGNAWERMRYSPARSTPEREDRTEEGDDLRRRAICNADLNRSGDSRPRSSHRVEDPSSRKASAGYTERAPELHVPPNLLHKLPEPDQDAALDVKVAAEYLRLREPEAQGNIGRGRAANDLPPDQAHISPTTGPVPGPGRSPRDFESDVERTIREMERQLKIKGSVDLLGANGSSEDTNFGQGSPGGMDSTVGAFRLTSSAFPAPLSQPGEDEEGGILSRMDAFRVRQGKGKRRSGGLKDMWDGQEGYISGNHNHQRHGGGLADMWKEVDDAEDGGVFPGGRRSSSRRRQGPGIRKMWSGGDRGTPPGLQPQRQGPGLRALWSGPETAAEDAAKNDAQAAYIRALDRDTHERQAASSNSPQQQQQQQQWRRQTGDQSELSPGDISDEAGFEASASGGRDRGAGAIEHGTSLAGIGESSVMPTSRVSPPRPWELDRDEDRDRMLDKAKKAAYAEELRKQIAENEARKAAEKQASARFDPRTPNGNARGRVLSPQDDDFGVDQERSGRISSDWRASPPAARSDAAGQHSPGLANVAGNHSHLTVARRRLVEDVYGGDGMGMALNGLGYRCSSIASYANVNSKSREASLDPNGDGDPATAAAVATASASGVAVHLRTEAGVQGLSETNQRERLHRRAATLEYQRALQEQIAAKSRAKKEEEARRKREDEEEARKQQECMRQMEAEQEEERRRKQAEEQAQLDGLYRQQEEALRKKRGGNGTPLRRSGAGTSARDDRPSTRAHHFDTSFPGSPYQDRMSSQAQCLTELESSFSYDNPTTPRSRGVAPDVDNLPAGAQARAQVLRSSPSPGGPPIRSSLWRPRSALSDNPAGGTFTPMTERRMGSLADVCASVDSSALLMPSDLSRSVRALGSKRGAMRQKFVSHTDAGDNRCARGVISTALSAVPVRRGLPLEPTKEAPLRTHSILVPVESATLFPDVDGVDTLVLSEGDSEEMGLACGAGGDGGKALVGASHATGFASRDSRQDEMDALVSSWHNHKRQSRRESPSAELAPHESKAAGGFKGFCAGPTTVAESAPFDGPRGSRAPSENRNGYGPGNGKDVKESKAMTSRMMAPSPPVDEDARQRNHEPERPLKSDSMLLYPTRQRQQELPGALRSPPRVAAGVGGPSSAEGEDEVSPLTRLLAETPLKLPVNATTGDYGAAHLRNSFPVGGGGGSGGGSGSVNGDSSSGPGVARTARRPRAVWGARDGGGDAVAEALKRRGGGTPWEEIPDVGASYPGP